MDYFWKENKKFVIALAGALVVVYLYNAFVLGPIKAGSASLARDRRLREGEFKAAVAAGVPSEDVLHLARGELKRTRDLLASLREDVAFKEAERFRKSPGGEPLKAHYLFLKDDLHKELKDKAKSTGLFPANFMLEAAGDAISEDLARELLLRLAIVERLVQVAVDAKVDRIETIDALSGAERKDEAVTRKGAFLNKYSVYMKFKGDAQSVFKVLHGAQRKNAFLAVSHFECAQDDPSKDSFSAAMTVAILRADEKLPFDPAKEGKP